MFFIFLFNTFNVLLFTTVTVYSCGSKGGAPGDPPSQKCSQFHAVFGKFWKNLMLVSPWIHPWFMTFNTLSVL